MKAAQNTTSIAEQLRKAMTEQNTGANQIVQAVAEMRQSSASTARALAEQAVASEQASREAEKLAGQIVRVSTAMEEQTRGTMEITTAADSLRQQSAQAAKAMEEQAGALKHITSAAGNVARQVKLITTANTRHLDHAAGLRESLSGVLELTANNSKDVSHLHQMIVGETSDEGANPRPRQTRGRRRTPPAGSEAGEQTTST